MAFSLIADGVYPAVEQIDPDWLAQNGIKLVLADLDNTLASYSDSDFPEAAAAWARGLAQRGITLFILSNTRKPDRAGRFARSLGLPYIERAGKPKALSFHRAMERLGCAPAQTVMVGDQVFTDVLGAKNAGIPVLLVRPIRLAGNPGRYVRYAVELPFRQLAKGRSPFGSKAEAER
ncbi:hypothetical protein SDC9_91985 [bioreactor metagenome]|uniref:Phosphoglycolate phosphatase n=1 Tax=bioreactor metagenome TaxID=1076179 RepID=A0A644ZWE5_9ZZZZ